MQNITRYTNVRGPLYGAVEQATMAAQGAAMRQDDQGAKIALDNAERAAQQAIAQLKEQHGVLSRKGAGQDVLDQIAKEHNGVIALYRERIQPAIEVFQSIDPFHASAGYYPLGGGVIAPPGAGKYLHVPFEAMGAGGGGAAGAGAGIRFEVITPAHAINADVTMQTPQLPWINSYRVRGLLIRTYRDAGAANDFVGVRQFRVGGGPVLLTSENPYPVELFRMADTDRVGLRYNGEVGPANRLNLILRVHGPTAGAAFTAPAGNTVVVASAIVEVLDDAIYGRLNHPDERRRNEEAIGMRGGYYFPTGTPVASTQEEIQMTVETANALNMVNDATFQLTAAAATQTVDLITPQIHWAENEVVGVKIGTPNKASITDVVMVDNFRIGGGTQLPAMEGEIEGTNYLGDTGGALGGGMPTLVGLRTYPKLSAVNQMRLTLRARNGLTGAAGMGGASIFVPYVSVIGNRIKDEVLGAGVGHPISQRLLQVLR